MKKILIIGQKGLIGKNLYRYFKNKKINTRQLSFESFLKKKNLNDYNIIINCTSNQKFITGAYTNKNDNDLIIAKKIKNLKIKLVMLSTRKIYKAKFNINETDKKEPNCDYSKNKLLSEISVKRILEDRLLILRISNIISVPTNNKRKLHKTFSDIFFQMIKKSIIYKNKNVYKDFIGINKFNQIVFELIKKNSYGVYNISLGKKVYLDRVVSWLNYYNTKNIRIMSPNTGFNDDSFTLNNKKLMKKIKIKNNILELKNECLKISKNYFN